MVSAAARPVCPSARLPSIPDHPSSLPTKCGRFLGPGADSDCWLSPVPVGFLRGEEGLGDPRLGVWLGHVPPGHRGSEVRVRASGRRALPEPHGEKRRRQRRALPAGSVGSAGPPPPGQLPGVGHSAW